jgi:excisionase family DNA binding protein
MNRREPIRGYELRQMLRDGALLAQVPAQRQDTVEESEVLTLVDVAALLRVERHHVAKLIELGLPCHRIGSMRRFIRREVFAWLQAQEEPSDGRRTS